MGMMPVTSNVDNRSCDNPVSSNCVQYAGPSLPCITICKGASITDSTYAIGNKLCGVINDLTALQTSNVLDFSGLDLGCLYQETLVRWECPVGQEFIADSTAYPINGTPGFCQYCPPPPATGCVLTSNIPILTTTPNPVPRPTTLIGILQLIISKTPCCDPCAGVNIPREP